MLYEYDTVTHGLGNDHPEREDQGQKMSAIFFKVMSMDDWRIHGRRVTGGGGVYTSIVSS